VSESEIRALYADLLDAWNRRDAAAYAAMFSDDANVVGFDGSQMNGRAELERTIGAIFRDHQTSAYVWMVREVRSISLDVAILRAVVGMVPPGGSSINPAVNAIQTAVAARHDGRWRLELLQSTPAAFHGRPEESARLTEELQSVFAETERQEARR
jgi:uncharacterized protein (TIGR02246 family)